MAPKRSAVSPLPIVAGHRALSAYVPDLRELCRRAGIDQDALRSGSVTVPAAVLRLLISNCIRLQDLDEAAYLAFNPDVEKAVAAGEFVSAQEHYAVHGYFEGRSSPASIDESWYLGTYPDVAAALRAGNVDSAIGHYHASGRREGRSGSAAEHEARKAWDAAFSQP